MTNPILDALSDRVLLWDGAMGTQIQAAELAASDFEYQGRILDGCNEILNLSRPDVIEAIHDSYFQAGADLVETNTFGNTSIVLEEYGVSELVYDLSLAAAQIAKRSADKFCDKFVVGGVGPGTKLLSLGHTTWDEVSRTYFDAWKGLLDGGADALLIETQQDMLVLKAALVAMHDARKATAREVPIFVQVTMEQTGTMLLGTEIGAALNFIECFPAVAAIGINCSTGPVEMLPHVRFLSQNSTRPISVQPNAGLPVMEAGQAVYKLSAQEFADHHVRFIEEFGVAMVGGCCGTTPDHIKALSEAVSRKGHSDKGHWRACTKLFPGFDFELPFLDADSSEVRETSAYKLVGCSSLYQFQPYRQDTSFLIVGEKTNANGSKAFRDMLAAENWDGLTELARELEQEGSHVLDVCCAYVGRNEEQDMRTLLSHYNRHVTVPLMIDSTETRVIEVALQHTAGKAIVNSINFEDGEARLKAVLKLCRKYGAAVVALTIDEDGMAKTVESKVGIARRILAETRAAGLPDHDVFFDCLTFTLGSGDEEFRKSALSTLDAIREIKRLYPNTNSILGVSNVSFGLKPSARAALNSVFLHYALDSGLTAAIVHGSKIRPQSKIDPEVWEVCADLIFDRRVFAA